MEVFSGKAPELLMIRLLDQHGPVVVLETGSGKVVNRLMGPFSRRWEQLAIRETQGQWCVTGPRQCLVLQADGKLQWRDGLYREGAERFVQQFVGDQHVAVLYEDRSVGNRQKANPQ